MFNQTVTIGAGSPRRPLPHLGGRSWALATALLLGAASVPAIADTLSGRITAIGDGDTVMFVDAANQQHQIRLAGIDAPEKNQESGQKATTNLSAMAFDKLATADCRKRTALKHDICVVRVEGKDLGLEQVRAGLAWAHAQYVTEQTSQEAQDYHEAEFNAKIRRLGLWAGPHPLPPWDWRRGRLDE